MQAHACQTEVAQSADTSLWIEEEIGGFDVTMDDSPSVYVVQRMKHTPEVLLDSGEREGAEVMLQRVVNQRMYQNEWHAILLHRHDQPEWRNMLHSFRSVVQMQS